MRSARTRTPQAVARPPPAHVATRAVPASLDASSLRVRGPRRGHTRASGRGVERCARAGEKVLHCVRRTGARWGRRACRCETLHWGHAAPQLAMGVRAERLPRRRGWEACWGQRRDRARGAGRARAGRNGRCKHSEKHSPPTCRWSGPRPQVALATQRRTSAAASRVASRASSCVCAAQRDGRTRRAARAPASCAGSARCGPSRSGVTGPRGPPESRAFGRAGGREWRVASRPRRWPSRSEVAAHRSGRACGIYLPRCALPSGRADLSTHKCPSVCPASNRDRDSPAASRPRRRATHMLPRDPLFAPQISRIRVCIQYSTFDIHMFRACRGAQRLRCKTCATTSRKITEAATPNSEGWGGGTWGRGGLNATQKVSVIWSGRGGCDIRLRGAYMCANMICNKNGPLSRVL